MLTVGTNTYKYDAKGRRKRKTISGTVTDYFYSGSVVVSEKQGSTWTDYVFFGSQRIVKQTGSAASTATYIHTDHLGSTRVCTNSSGNSVGTCDYEPFGELPVGASCSVPVNYRFAGMEWDSESGLYHTWFRQYDSSQGRWMSVDPLPGTEGDPQSQDRYAYVTSDPVNLLDPWGLIHTRCFRLCFVDVVGYRFEGDHPSEPIGPIYDISRCSIFCLIERLGPGGPGGGLGIRAPGQTFGECMALNANTYSIGGSLELLANVATGHDTDISSNIFVNAVTGNNINTLLFGSGPSAAASASAQTPGLVSRAMGEATTIGRRTTNITALNTAGIRGGPPLALSQASRGAKAVLGSMGKALNLGLSATARLGIDVGFTAAEAINCSIPR